MTRHKLILSLAIVTAFTATAPALAFQAIAPNILPSNNIVHVNNEALKENAYEFISNLMTQGVSILENENISDKQQQKKFSELLHNNFDMKTIARFSLGRYWRTSSKSEQKEYLKLFEDMIIEVYSRRFSDYNGQKVAVVSARDAGKSDVLVSSTITPETGSKIDVEWRVRKKKNGKLKVIDVIVEGVSMSMTQRSDFASVIQRGGGKVEVLLAHLRPED